MVHQHSYAAQTYHKSQTEPERQTLRAQENNLHQRDEHRNGRQHHGRNPRRHALLGPKQTAVINNENERPERGGRHPLTPCGNGRALEPQPHIHDQAGSKKAHCRQQKRRHFVDPDPDR